MPSDEVRLRLYGPSYEAESKTDYYIEDTKDDDALRVVLEETPKGTFVDFGCGRGRHLLLAQQVGWEPIGIEFEQDVVDEVADRTELPVITYDSIRQNPIRADIVHLADVIEHFTDFDEEFGAALSMVAPGGLIVAQGPLENERNLLTWVLRVLGRIRSRREHQTPPWHSVLATAKGQIAMFQRFGLQQIEFRVWETSWPAPSKLRPNELINLRAVSLFCIRRMSLMLGRVIPLTWGNRYFYVGRKETRSIASR